jgi:hypothetical protein
MFLHLLKIKKFLEKALESEGHCRYIRGESRGWLNENLKNTLPKDSRVSGLSDTGFVSLPELTGGDGNVR